MSKYDLVKIQAFKDSGLDWNEIGKKYGVSGAAVRRAYFRLKEKPQKPKTTEHRFDIDKSQAIHLKDFSISEGGRIVERIQYAEPSTTKKKGTPTDDLRLIYRVLKGKTTRKGFYHIRDELVEILKEL